MSIIKGKLSAVLLFLLSFAILTRFNIDPDFGWHMAYGEVFLAGGEIIRGDPFSFTMPGYAWGNSYFLYQIIVAYIFNNFGYWFLAVLFGLVASISVLILFRAENSGIHTPDEVNLEARKREPRPSGRGNLSFKNLNFTRSAFVILGTAIAASNLGLRPHTFSFLFFAILLIFLEKGLFNKSKYMFLWFLFFVLWANIHRGFMMGILVFSTFLLLDFFNKRMQKKKQELIIYAGCLLAAIGGTFVTPFPLGLYKSGVFFDLTTFENLRYIAEWQPLVLVSPLSIFLAVSGVVFIKIFNKYYKRIGPTWIIIAAFLFSFAYVAATFAFFWAAIFIFLVSRYLSFSLKMPYDFFSNVPIATSILAVSLAFFLTFTAGLLESYDFEKRLVLDGYPVEALEYLENKDYAKTGLFNAYEWGGFIDWKYTDIKVFIDGRMAGWRRMDGTSILGDYIKIMKGNCEILSEFNVELALIKKNSNTPCFSEWEIEYQDDVAKILRRADI